MGELCMNDIMWIYLSTASISTIFNSLNYFRMHVKAKSKSKRNLKYKKDLSPASKASLRDIDRDYLALLFDGIKSSFIPVYNVWYTVENITSEDELSETFEEEYDLLVDEANEREEIARSIYLSELRKYKDNLLYIDKEVEEKLNDDNYRPSIKVFKKTLKYIDPNTEIKEDN